MDPSGLEIPVRHDVFPDADIRAAQRQLEGGRWPGGAPPPPPVPAAGRVAEDQDDSADAPPVVDDAVRTVVDGHLCAVSGQQHRVIGQSDHGAQAEYLGRRVLDRLAGLLVDDVEHLREWPSGGFPLRPSRQRLGRRVQENHPRLVVGRDDGVADARQRDRVAALTLAELVLRRALVEGHLDDRAQLGILERLEEVAERLRDPCPLQGLVVRIGRQEDHGNLTATADLLGRINPVEGTLEPDVHQHQVRLRLQRQTHGVFTQGCDTDHGVADPGQLVLDVSGDDAIVLDNEDPGRCHRSRSPRLSVSNVIVKVVPPSRFTMILPWSCCVRSSTSCRPSELAR